MAINKTITNLSLTYCNIDAQGARALFDILIFTKSNLEELNLSSNPINDKLIDFSYLTNLWNLDIENSGLIDTIPNFTNLPSLIRLDIGQNDLTGNLPLFSR